MGESERLRRLYEANFACGDIGEVQESRMLAEIAAAEAAESSSKPEFPVWSLPGTMNGVRGPIRP